LNYYQFLTIKEEDEQNSDENSCPNQSEFSPQKLNTSTHLGTDSHLSHSNTDHLNSSVNDSNKNLKSSFEVKRQLIENDFDKCNSQTISLESHSNVLDSHATALEIDRLKCRITNLESQIDLSAIHLNESKENAERLT